MPGFPQLSAYLGVPPKDPSEELLDENGMPLVAPSQAPVPVPAMPPPPPSKDFLPGDAARFALGNAQKQDRDAAQASSLGRALGSAGDLVASASSRRAQYQPTSQALFDALDKNRGSKVQDLMQQQGMDEHSFDFKRKQGAAALEDSQHAAAQRKLLEESDPASASSVSYRAMVAKLSPQAAAMPGFDKMTAAQLKAVLPGMDKLLESSDKYGVKDLENRSAKELEGLKSDNEMERERFKQGEETKRKQLDLDAANAKDNKKAPLPVGFSATQDVTPKQAEEFGQHTIATQNLVRKAQEYKQLVDEASRGEQLYGQKAGQLESLRADLQLGVQKLHGINRLNDVDVNKFLEKLVPSVSGYGNLLKSRAGVDAALDHLVQSARSDFSAQRRTLGIKADSPDAKSVERGTDAERVAALAAQGFNAKQIAEKLNAED